MYNASVHQFVERTDRPAMVRRTPSQAFLAVLSRCLVVVLITSAPGFFSSCGRSPAHGRSSSLDAGAEFNNSADSGSGATPDSPDTSPARVGSLPFGWQSVAPVGSPGWRDSQEPLCDVRQGVGLGETLGVWADSRGVFALVDNECVYIDLTLAGCPNDGQGHQATEVEFNDGSGWRTLFQEQFTVYDGFTGFPDGPLVMTRGSCTAAFLDFGATETDCSLPSELQSTYPPPAFFVAGSNLAYVAVPTALGEYRSGSWNVLLNSMPETITAIWANDNLAYLAGEYQLYSWQGQPATGLVALPNAPTANYTAAWALKEDDVWFGNTVGQLVHYDGTSFRILQASTIDRGGIVGLWGQGDQLYFYTGTEFGRVVNGTSEILLTVPLASGGAITGLWGLSPQEVFLAIAGSYDSRTVPCTQNSMFWFDGVSFHQF